MVAQAQQIIDCKSPPAPTAILGPDTICWGAPLRFSAEAAIPGAVYGWAISDGWLSRNNGPDVAAACKGKPPYTLYLWRESSEAPYCHSDTISKTLYLPVVKLNLHGPDTVSASSYATYHIGYEDAEVYEWKIYNPLAGSVAYGGQGSSATILWNEVSAPGVTAYIVVLARKCGRYYTDTMDVYVKAATLVQPHKLKGTLYAARCLGTSYEVTLAIPGSQGTPVADDSLNWYLNDVLIATTGAPTYTLGLPPDSTYRIRLEHKRHGRARRPTHDVMRLPPLPVAGFTVSTATPCTEEVAVHFINQSDTAKLRSHWHFGDGSYNTQHNPYKVFSSNPGGFYAVILTVTDSYGCVDTAVQIINAKSNDIKDGYVTADPAFPSEQTPVTLYYGIGGGFAYPDTLKWMKLDGAILATTYAPDYSIHAVQSGGYWLQAVNRFGCADHTPVYPVMITEVPEAVIRGAASQPAGADFYLNGYAGSGDAYAYTWHRDGAVAGTGAVLQQGGLAAGRYVYTLTLSLRKPDGQTCFKTSPPFILTVRDANQKAAY